MNIARPTRKDRAEPDAGYTLLEVLIVLTIVVLIAAVVGPRLIGFLGKAKTDTAKIQISELVSAVELYYLDNGQYPAKEAGLAALTTKPTTAPKWNGPYLKKPDGLRDPWGTPFVYKVPGQHSEFEILSLGRDNAVGGTGEDADVSNY